jgi:hypothetical protein
MIGKGKSWARVAILIFVILDTGLAFASVLGHPQSSLFDLSGSSIPAALAHFIIIVLVILQYFFSNFGCNPSFWPHVI